MGTFTGDRKALAITDNGARVVWTPRYATEQNVQSRLADVTVDPQGNATATVKTTYSGLKYETGYLDLYIETPGEDQKKWVQENTNIPSFDLNSYSMKNYKSRLPSAVVGLNLKLKKL